MGNVSAHSIDLQGVGIRSLGLRKHHCRPHQDQPARYRIPIDCSESSLARATRKANASRQIKHQNVRDLVASVESNGFAGRHFGGSFKCEVEKIVTKYVSSDEGGMAVLKYLEGIDHGHHAGGMALCDRAEIAP